MNTKVAIMKERSGMPALGINEDELINVLRNSLYPGAQTDSIKLVIGYCKAAALDPIQKPVHIVPMWDNKLSAMRDVIMPGIGSYRTQAARSGEYAGVSDAEFGADVTENIGGTEVTFPTWCKVTVKRLLQNGTIAEFSATERWKENYAFKGGKDRSIAPNTMWMKRPYAQLAKCAEAQALRKAFPELGAAPTADEMEGKPLNEISGETIDGATGEITGKKAAPVLPAYTDEQIDANIPAWQVAINKGKSHETIIAMVRSKYTLTDEQLNIIRGITREEKREPVTIENDAPAIDAKDLPF
jgi:phage recombination protein Bet